MGLLSVMLPSALTTSGNGAFETCDNLTSISIPASVTAIGTTAFKDCPALISLTCLVPIPLVINANVFGGTTNQAACDLYTTDASSQALYEAAPVWQDFGTTLSTNNFDKVSFIMYPNPTSENLTITLENNVALENVNFYNTLGQLVKTSNTTTTNISELAKGNYFVEVITKQGKATKTIVIK
ncbi:hypothetical protein RCH18_001245 [Flavobacterium sp. PL11]|jgi:hypothetical protein|nr:hypothetical protein [Flavobacterium sp. PL11]